jgi:hypothetical protein
VTAAVSTPLTRTAAITRATLTTAMLTLTAAISMGAGWLSLLAVRDLAVQAGWPPDTAWVVQPIVELFLVAGSLEIVCRAWEGRTDLAYPKALIAAALVVVLAANVTDHVLTDHVLRAAQSGRPGPMLVLVGSLAALVPAAQLGSLHLMSGRLDSLGRRTHHPHHTPEDITTEPTADPTTPPLDAAPSQPAAPRPPPPPVDRAATVAAVVAGTLTRTRPPHEPAAAPAPSVVGSQPSGQQQREPVVSSSAELTAVVEATILDREVCAMSEAARLLGVRAARLRSWVDGYSRAGRTYDPVIRLHPTGNDVLTWGEFVEAGYFREPRPRGTSSTRTRYL